MKIETKLYLSTVHEQIYLVTFHHFPPTCMKFTSEGSTEDPFWLHGSYVIWYLSYSKTLRLYKDYTNTLSFSSLFPYKVVKIQTQGTMLFMVALFHQLEIFKMSCSSFYAHFLQKPDSLTHLVSLETVGPLVFKMK